MTSPPPQAEQLARARRREPWWPSRRGLLNTAVFLGVGGSAHWALARVLGPAHPRLADWGGTLAGGLLAGGTALAAEETPSTGTSSSGAVVQTQETTPDGELCDEGAGGSGSDTTETPAPAASDAAAASL